MARLIRYMLIALGILLLIGLFGIIASQPNTPVQSTRESPSAMTITTATSTASEKTSKLVWKKAMELNGAGIMNTETFKITGEEWRIKWVLKGGDTSALQIFVYDSYGDPVGVAANIQGEGSDVSYIHKKGCFYLKINSANGDWSILIEEKIPDNAEPVGSVIPSQYKIVKSWTGKGIKTTEKFTITKTPWKISWSTTSSPYGLLQIFIYDEDGNPVDLVANVNGGQGYSYIYTKEGPYYLTINSANIEWKVIVEEPAS